MKKQQPNQQQLNNHDRDSIDRQTLARLINQIPDDKSPSSRKFRQSYRRNSKPQSNPNRGPETEPELDPSFESEIESRFDPDEAYEDTPSPSYRNKEI